MEPPRVSPAFGPVPNEYLVRVWDARMTDLVEETVEIHM